MRSSSVAAVVVFALACAGACQPAQRDAGSPAPSNPASDGAKGAQETTTAEPSSACTAPEPAEEPGTQIVSVYFACDGRTPGQLYPVHRRVPESVDLAHATIEEMMRGPTDAERARGFSSLFTEATAGMLHSGCTQRGGRYALDRLRRLPPRTRREPQPDELPARWRDGRDHLDRLPPVPGRERAPARP